MDGHKLSADSMVDGFMPVIRGKNRRDFLWLVKKSVPPGNQPRPLLSQQSLWPGSPWMRLGEKTGASSCLDLAPWPQSGWSQGTGELLPGPQSRADSWEDARIWEKKKNKIIRGNIGFTGHSGLILNLKVSQLWAPCAPSSRHDPSRSTSLYCLSLLIQILFRCDFKKAEWQMEDTRVFSSESQACKSRGQAQSSSSISSPLTHLFLLSTFKNNNNKKAFL